MTEKEEKRREEMAEERLDEFCRSLSTSDTKKKLTVGTEIIAYLSDEDNGIQCEDLGAFVDGLVPWMQSSNFKVRIKMSENFTRGYVKFEQILEVKFF